MENFVNKIVQLFPIKMTGYIFVYKFINMTVRSNRQEQIISSSRTGSLQFNLMIHAHQQNTIQHIMNQFPSRFFKLKDFQKTQGLAAFTLPPLIYLLVPCLLLLQQAAVERYHTSVAVPGYSHTLGQSNACPALLIQVFY